MTAILLRILDQDVELECASHERRRLEDLAALLNARLAAYPANQDCNRRLALAALSLLDETQARAAALMRARSEIDRLTDMLVEVRVSAATVSVDDERGRVSALRAL
jgi:hypothetical protein